MIDEDEMQDIWEKCRRDARIKRVRIAYIGGTYICLARDAWCVEMDDRYRDVN